MGIFRGRPILKWGLITSFVLTVIGLIAAWLFWQSLYRGMPTLPATAELWDANREAAIEYVDRNGKTIAIRGPRYGRAVSIDELPPHVPRAFLAAEDKRFYQHDGADTQAMVRAAWSNLISGRTVSGASTITQQTAKNVFLWQNGGYVRKGLEAWFAFWIENVWGKRRIMEVYLNVVEWGDGYFGAEAAAQGRFGKPASELTAFEAARLAAVLPSPNKWRVAPAGPYVRQRTATIQARMGVVQRDGLDACVID